MVGVGAAPLRPEEAGGVAVVDHDQGVVLVGQRPDVLQLRDVAVHREGAVGGDDDVASAVGPGLLQLGLQIGHVRVGEAVALGLAQPNAVDDRGVVQAVRDDGVLGPEQRLEDAAVGVEGGGEQDGVLEAEIVGDGLFELLVDLERAADEAHRGGAGAPFLLRPDAGLDDALVAGEAEVVVGAEVQDVAAADLDHRPLAGGDHPFRLGQALGVDVGEFRGDAVMEAGCHVRSATPFSARFEAPEGSGGRNWRGFRLRPDRADGNPAAARLERLIQGNGRGVSVGRDTDTRRPRADPFTLSLMGHRAPGNVEEGLLLRCKGNKDVGLARARVTPRPLLGANGGEFAPLRILKSNRGIAMNMASLRSNVLDTYDGDSTAGPGIAAFGRKAELGALAGRS